MEEEIKKLLEKLSYSRDKISSIEVSIGLDAFVDKIQKVIKEKENKQVFFDNISEFGEHIKSKAGKSCSVEVIDVCTKFGGNAPIMAHSLWSLGAKVNCIGALGTPTILTLFKEGLQGCNLYSIGNPGYTTALEFEDGKVMLSQREKLDNINWEQVKKSLGIEIIQGFFRESKLIALVNFAGIKNFNHILQGILSDLKFYENKKENIVFFDMADFSTSSKEKIQEGIELIVQFSKYYKVILGLNENEAMLLSREIGKEAEDISDIGQGIFNHIKVDTLVIHTNHTSLVFYQGGMVKRNSLYTKYPKLSTGAGDNFNAGFCFAQLMGFNYIESLYCANATTGYYIRNGESPSLDDLIWTLDNWQLLINT